MRPAVRVACELQGRLPGPGAEGQREAHRAHLAGLEHRPVTARKQGEVPGVRTCHERVMPVSGHVPVFVTVTVPSALVPNPTSPRSSASGCRLTWGAAPMPCSCATTARPAASTATIRPARGPSFRGRKRTRTAQSRPGPSTLPEQPSWLPKSPSTATWAMCTAMLPRLRSRTSSRSGAGDPHGPRREVDLRRVEGQADLVPVPNRATVAESPSEVGTRSSAARTHRTRGELEVHRALLARGDHRSGATAAAHDREVIVVDAGYGRLGELHGGRSVVRQRHHARAAVGVDGEGAELEHRRGDTQRRCRDLGLPRVCLTPDL